MSQISISDWISIFCSFISLFVTIIIAGLQMRQSKKMADFEKRQDEREEQRYAENVKKQAVSFISKYYSNRGLIPLCAMAAMHNELFYYSREMYREFCCLRQEVQNAILEYCNLDLRVTKIDDFFGKCIDAVENVIKENFPNDESVFYEGGKYVYRSLKYFSNEKIPNEYIKYHAKYMDNPLTKAFNEGKNENALYDLCIRDVLREAFKSDKTDELPIFKLKAYYDFASSTEIEACQFVTTLAKYIAIFGSEKENDNSTYGTPGGYAGETIDTMEDLFLQTLFYIYINLIL